MASGQLALAFTESLPAAIGARAVVGLGDAFTFISVLRLVPHWFTPRQVPLVTQLTGICGQLGQVLSAIPFFALLSGSGWTTAYVSVAALGVLSIVLTLAPGPGHARGPRRRVRKPRRSAKSLASVKTVWLRPGTRLGFFTHMGTQFSVTVFALMWGVPYLTVAQGLSATGRGNSAHHLGRRRHLLGHPDRHLHRPPPAPPVAAGALHHRQQCRHLVGGAGPSRPCAALAAGGPGRRHLGRRPRIDGRIRFRPHLQPARDAGHRIGHGQHGRLHRVAARHAVHGRNSGRGRATSRSRRSGWRGPFSTPSGRSPWSAS